MFLETILKFITQLILIICQLKMSNEVKKIIHNKLYRSQEFAKDRQKMTQFIKNVNNLEIDEDLFKIMRILIRFFRFSILVLFNPIYKRIEMEKQKYIVSYHDQLIKTAGIVKAILKTRHFFSLQFYFKSGCISDELELKADKNQEGFINGILVADNRLNQKVCSDELDQDKRLKVIQDELNKAHQSSPALLQKLCIEYYLKEVSDRRYQIKKELTLQKQILINPVNKHQNIYAQQQNGIEDGQTNNNFLCCRSYFYESQIINEPQTLVQEYKNYDYPFNRFLKDILAKTICGFLNARGGIIYIGIKQDNETKQRIVVGQTFSESAKQNLLRYFRVLCEEKISPEIANQQLYKLEFVPLKNSKNQCITGRYVARLRVQMGSQKELYSFKKLDGDQLFAFRTQNQVLSKRMSQQIIEIYRKRLNSTQQRTGYVKHSGFCKPVQMGKQLLESSNMKIQLSVNSNLNKPSIINTKTKEANRSYQQFKKSAFVCLSKALVEDLKKFGFKAGRTEGYLYSNPKDIQEQNSIELAINQCKQKPQVIKISKMLEILNATLTHVEKILSRILYTQINQNTIGINSFEQVMDAIKILKQQQISYKFIFLQRKTADI